MTNTLLVPLFCGVSAFAATSRGQQKAKRRQGIESNGFALDSGFEKEFGVLLFLFLPPGVQSGLTFPPFWPFIRMPIPIREMR